jgi:plasmid replication initiation protein
MQRSTVQVRLASDELNLVEFPFALLADRQPDGISTLVFSDEIRGPDGAPVERIWTVTGADEFGLPTASDEIVYLVLTEITREQGFGGQKVHFSRYDLVRRLGWADKGSSYARLRRSLDRLLGVTITAKRAFWDRATKTYVDVGFHIIDDYAIFDEPRGRKGPGSATHRSFIRWNKTIFASFLAGYVKRVDLGTYLRLQSAVSRRLYRYLDKKRYDGKGRFQISMTKLAFEKLGMSRTYFPSHIRAELARAHEELLRNGFLRSVDYEAAVNSRETVVVYRFGRAVQPPVEHEEIVRKLIDLGVAEPVAVELALADPAGVEEQLGYLPHRAARDPAALIVTAVREQWPAPAASRDTTVAPRLEIDAEETAAPQPEDEIGAALAGLDEAERAELQRKAEEEVRQLNPRVAKYPESAAFRALVRDALAKLVRK